MCSQLAKLNSSQRRSKRPLRYNHPRRPRESFHNSSNRLQIGEQNDGLHVSHHREPSDVEPNGNGPKVDHRVELLWKHISGELHGEADAAPEYEVDSEPDEQTTFREQSGVVNIPLNATESKSDECCDDIG